MNKRQYFTADKWNFQSESVLDGLPEEDLNFLYAHKSEQVYGKGEVIFREGAYPSGIFFIKKGRVKKYKADQTGGAQIIYIAQAGELIGFSAVLADSRYPDSAAALEESKIIFIPREDFQKTLRHSPILNARLLKILSREFAVLTNSLTLFSRKNVKERLALHLLVLQEKYKDVNGAQQVIEINLSREDLANLVGTARENVVRILSEFKDAGWIETKGRKIVLRDIKKLVELADYG